MKNLLNPRYLFFAALCFVAGIAAVISVIYGKWFCAAIIAAVFIVAVIICAAKKARKGIIVCFVMFAFAAAGLTVTLTMYAVTESRRIGYKEGVIIGTVTDDITEIGDNYYSALLRNASLCLENDCVIQLRGKVSATFSGEMPSVGNVVSFKAEVFDVYFLKSRPDTFSYRNRIFYQARPQEPYEIISKGAPKLDEICRDYIKNVLTDNMPESYDVAYALMIGDKSLMSGEDLEAFARSGIMHLLAVSGLHIGFLAATSEFILKKFKVKSVGRFALIFPVLTAYSFVCGFSPSCVRALVMTAAAFITRTLYRKTDLLSSLSIAAVFILAFRPLYVLDAGFLLSVGAVFGIATFTAAFDRFVRFKICPHFLKAVARALGVSLGATLGTFCATAYFYGKVPLFGVLVNLAAVPLASLSFVLCFTGLLPSVFRYILFIPDKILYGLKLFAAFVSEIPFSSVPIGALALTGAAVVIWLFIAGEYVNLRSCGKVFAHALMSLVIVITATAELMPLRPVSGVYVAFRNNSYDTAVLSKSGEAAVISDFSNLYGATELFGYLQRFQHKPLSLFLTDYRKTDVLVLDACVNTVGIGKAYLLADGANDAADEFFRSKHIDVIAVPKGESVGDAIEVKPLFDGAFAGYTVFADGISFAAAAERDFAVTNNFSEVIAFRPDFVIAFGVTQKFCDDFSRCAVLTSADISAKNVYGANKYGNFTISRIRDKMHISY